MRTMLKPHNRKKYRTSGFRARMSTKRGRGVISRRRRKGRRHLTISDEK